MTPQPSFVYIMASAKNGTLYVGVTSDLVRRVSQHRQGITKGFVGKYNVTRLVFFECAENLEAAIQREKRVKKWNRAWKIRLIEECNPSWKDLYDEISG